MYRECPICEAKELETATFDPGAQTYSYEWKAKAEEREKNKKDGTKEKFTARLTAKEKVDGSRPHFSPVSSIPKRVLFQSALSAPILTMTHQLFELTYQNFSLFWRTNILLLQYHFPLFGS